MKFELRPRRIPITSLNSKVIPGRLHCAGQGRLAMEEVCVCDIQ